MRTSAPAILPLFRSEMQMRLLALLLLQPEREWTLQGLAGALRRPTQPASSPRRASVTDAREATTELIELTQQFLSR
jgi:hypothetical protein